MLQSTYITQALHTSPVFCVTVLQFKQFKVGNWSISRNDATLQHAEVSEERKSYTVITY